MIKNRFFYAAGETAKGGVVPGELWSWGQNDYGQLGFPPAGDEPTPVPVGSDTDWVMVKGGGAQNVTIKEGYSLGLKSNGTLWSWGSNYRAQTGLNTAVGYTTTPTQVGTDTDWAYIGGGFFHSVAVKTDGTLWAWGFNGNGATGQSLTTGNTLVPTQVGVDTDWLRAEAGGGPNTAESVTLALKTDGTLWSFGSNALGQTGLGTSTGNTLVPTQVGAATWLDIAAGGQLGFGVQTDGTLWTWGANQGYGTGRGTGVGFTLSPAQNGVATDWFAVGRGSQNGFALKGAGELWSWGVNNSGVTGQGTPTVAVQNPTRVGAASNWILVNSTVGETYQFAQGLRSDGTLWGWGSNFEGRNGTGVTVTPPTQVGTDTDWTTVNAGLSHSLALKT